MGRSGSYNASFEASLPYVCERSYLFIRPFREFLLSDNFSFRVSGPGDQRRAVGSGRGRFATVFCIFCAPRRCPMHLNWPAVTTPAGQLLAQLAAQLVDSNDLSTAGCTATFRTRCTQKIHSSQKRSNHIFSLSSNSHRKITCRAALLVGGKLAAQRNWASELAAWLAAKQREPLLIGRLFDARCRARYAAGESA